MLRLVSIAPADPAADAEGTAGSPRTSPKAWAAICARPWKRRCAARCRSRSTRQTWIGSFVEVPRRLLVVFIHENPARLFRLRRRLCPGKGAGGLDQSGRGFGNAGLGFLEAGPRTTQQSPVGIGRGRQRARRLFVHRPETRHSLALLRRPGRDQPRPGRPAGRFTRALGARPCAPERNRASIFPVLPPMAALVGYLAYTPCAWSRKFPPRAGRFEIPDSVFVCPTR